VSNQNSPNPNFDFSSLLSVLSTGLNHLSENLKSNFRFSKLTTKEDLFLWIQLSKKYNLIGYNKVLSDWRKLDNSLSSNTTQKILDGFRLYYQYVGFNIFKSIYYLVLLSVNFIKKNI